MFGKNKNQIILEEISSSEIKAIKEGFTIPDHITDQEIISALINDLIDRYFNVEYWTQDDIEKLLDFTQLWCRKCGKILNINADEDICDTCREERGL